ncbi:MAG: PilN domain-containing protein [Nitrospira sp.]|nr:PilN domain-containing protein [Nitrospira sp.]
MRLSVAPRHIHVLHGLQWGLSGLFLGSSLLTAVMWAKTQEVREDATRYAEAAERTTALNQTFTAQQERDQLTLSAAQISRIQQEVRLVNQLAEKRGFSWTQLLADLEEAVPSGISVSRIQRDEHTSTLTIAGHATGMETLKTLLSMLQARPGFHEPVLHRHDLSDSSRPAGAAEPQVSGVAFSVTVQYRGMVGNGGRHEVS